MRFSMMFVTAVCVMFLMNSLYFKSERRKSLLYQKLLVYPACNEQSQAYLFKKDHSHLIRTTVGFKLPLNQHFYIDKC